jgi:hypothetical protein
MTYESRALSPPGHGCTLPGNSLQLGTSPGLVVIPLTYWNAFLYRELSAATNESFLPLHKSFSILVVLILTEWRFDRVLTILYLCEFINPVKNARTAFPFECADLSSFKSFGPYAMYPS